MTCACRTSVCLHNRGLREVAVLDLFDPRATLRYDMNAPVPESSTSATARCSTSAAWSVFDTRQCLNCLRMVRPGGCYFLHTPVKGFFGHGLHALNRRPCSAPSTRTASAALPPLLRQDGAPRGPRFRTGRDPVGGGAQAAPARPFRGAAGGNWPGRYSAEQRSISPSSL
jgi:hypothetical protein